jgi:hypothetical protein
MVKKASCCELECSLGIWFLVVFSSPTAGAYAMSLIACWQQQLLAGVDVIRYVELSPAHFQTKMDGAEGP